MNKENNKWVILTYQPKTNSAMQDIIRYILYILMI